MLRATGPRRRRGALIGASTAILCLGGLLGGCAGGDGREGYTAAGPVQGSPAGSGAAVAPTNGVTLVPLSPPRAPGTSETPGPPGDTAYPTDPSAADVDTRTGTSTGTAGASPTPARRPPGTSARPRGGGATPSGPTTSGSGQGPSPSATDSGPRTPAALTVSAPVREPTDRRWCETVTVSLRNTGGTAVRSGTATLGTHIIGGLGVDWATRTSSGTLPAPIAPGASVRKTWTVCVDAWRVPLGMHIETRDVSVRWS
ncbi:hypothetical protein AB0C59_33405 [Streptomyces sp. NPDC048664]|uniref:hypothetical protein n=1 Tax=Streptomyces sp. NPDC048664 TaxID=3154505 RepID=UPI00342D682B